MLRWTVLLLLLLPGCFGGDVDHRVTGSFTADRPASALDDLQRWAEERGGETVIMESFPEQFGITGMSLDGCQSLVALLRDQAWIAAVSECKAES